MNCGCCSEVILEEGSAVKCSQCKKLYHHSCFKTILAGAQQQIEQQNWLCPTCKPRTSNADHTPLRNKQVQDMNITHRKKETQIGVILKDEGTPVTSAEVSRIVKNEIDGLMRHLNQTLATYVNKELKVIKENIDEIRKSMEFMNEKYEEMKKEVSAKISLVHDVQRENEQLKATVKDLNTRVNQMEQQARSSNLEIQCLPEHKNENLVSTVMNIGRIISCELSENNIHHVTRTAKQTASNNRPKSVVVQFSSPRVRDTFLAASIKFNKSKTPEEKLNSGLLGISGKRESIYIVEHLSPANKNLHAATRIKAKKLGYQYVWIRNGRIFVRKTDGADYKYIKDHDALDKLN
ncbi:hypothetical protein ABMA27_011507 [Loxostege sticticalis]|uniref:Zinc finger PHD-type domain-containing protein n=1 Tax=Loxostege sticticalis TaxID=481309 RepID=A0ABR3IGI8_LOXSC